MFPSKEAELSSDELREKLIQIFKNKGVLNSFKAQFQHHLIKKLNSNVPGSSEAVPRLVPVKLDPLLVSFCNSIVADHLHISGYQYTLSVFCPESGLSNDRALKKEELLQFLRISPESALHSSLSSNKETDKGFLINLLTQLTHHFTPSVRHDVETQTTSHPNCGESLVEKMRRIDKEYENICTSRQNMFSSQTHLASYRKQIQAQVEAESNTKIQHFKDVEIAKARMEEKTKYHQEFEKLKQDLERTYEMKAKGLMDREKNATDRLQRQQEKEENNAYMQRQSLLKEIEAQRDRENEFKMRTDEFEKTCQRHEEKVKTMEDLFRSREQAVKTAEETCDQQLKNQLLRFQLELKEDYLKRTEKLTERETKNKLESARLQKEAAVMDAGLEEHSRACSQLKQLKAELDTAQQHICLLKHQRTKLNERLETFSDYPNLTRERAVLQKELQNAQEESRGLREAMLKPSNEQLALQQEVCRLQRARKRDQEELDSQKQVLQAQLQSEVERFALLKAHLKECEKKLDRENKYVDDINEQRRQIQQGLDNEVLRRPQPSLSERSVLKLSADKHLPFNIHADRAVKRTRLTFHHASEAGAQERTELFWRNDMDWLEKAKARMMELQREADNLEKSYRDYQQNTMDTNISHRLPAKALSPQQGRPSLHCPEFSPELRSRPFPQQRSKLQPVYSSSESSSQPEKICIQDITELLPEASDRDDESPGVEGKEEECALQQLKRERKERRKRRQREEDEVREQELHKLQELEQLRKETVVVQSAAGLEEPIGACSQLNESVETFSDHPSTPDLEEWIQRLLQLAQKDLEDAREKGQISPEEDSDSDDESPGVERTKYKCALQQFRRERKERRKGRQRELIEVREQELRGLQELGQQLGLKMVAAHCDAGLEEPSRARSHLELQETELDTEKEIFLRNQLKTMLNDRLEMIKDYPSHPLRDPVEMQRRLDLVQKELEDFREEQRIICEEASDAEDESSGEEGHALQQWKIARKERLENRHREQDEVREIDLRELKELEQLEKEMVVAITAAGLCEPSGAYPEFEELQEMLRDRRGWLRDQDEERERELRELRQLKLDLDCSHGDDGSDAELDENK